MSEFLPFLIFFYGLAGVGFLTALEKNRPVSVFGTVLVVLLWPMLILYISVRLLLREYYK